MFLVFLKNNELNFIFLARLLLSLPKTEEFDNKWLFRLLPIIIMNVWAIVLKSIYKIYII